MGKSITRQLTRSEAGAVILKDHERRIAALEGDRDRLLAALGTLTSRLEFAGIIRQPLDARAHMGDGDSAAREALGKQPCPIMHVRLSADYECATCHVIVPALR